MKTKTLAAVVAAWSLSAGSTQAATPATAFTYQGQLSEVGVPANGNYDLWFLLYDNGGGGNAVAMRITNYLAGDISGLCIETNKSFSGGRPSGCPSRGHESKPTTKLENYGKDIL